ncbi:hypothetical protein J6590_100021 [Homalodisca vitripennis]|nr:hypothetical protein J6590_100021 [Homalodisca vitripennis]
MESPRAPHVPNCHYAMVDILKTDIRANYKKEKPSYGFKADGRKVYSAYGVIGLNDATEYTTKS